MIEASSPLAAMQPPSFGMGHCGGAFRRAADAPSSYASLAAANSFGTNFNFRDLSMKKVQPDYFSLKPVRGSSPTASLAADLSQNFHIDHRFADSLPEQELRSMLTCEQSPAADS
jgi:M-phase inducer tyrosine phosphatase